MAVTATIMWAPSICIELLPRLIPHNPNRFVQLRFRRSDVKWQGDSAVTTARKSDVKKLHLKIKK